MRLPWGQPLSFYSGILIKNNLFLFLIAFVSVIWKQVNYNKLEHDI